MIPTALLDVLQVVVLVLVAAGATLVVRTKDRPRLVIVLSGYGMLLAILFFAFQAPDVSLSELTVGAILLPLILLLAINKVRQQPGTTVRQQPGTTVRQPPAGKRPE